jgi:conjugal transfer pilus assembly protein TraW
MTMNKCTMKLWLILITVFLALPCAAKDLGTFWATYPIAERDLLAEIEERVRNVDWEKVIDRNKATDKLKNYQPHDLVSLPRARQGRVRQVDLTYTLQFDITDEKGGIIYPKGFVFNPLDYIVYPRTIVVIDGSDKDQVDWFRRSSFSKALDAVLWISGGKYRDLALKLSRPVYYANSRVVDRFKLEAVPSVIVQKGNLLEVTEYDVESRKKK